MDELADKVRMDPVEFRIKNLPAEAPNRMWRKYFPVAAEKFGWSKRHATGDPTPGPIKRGMGCAANQWGGGGRGTKAHVEIHSDGGVVVRCGTQDIGTGTRTIIAIAAAETLGLPYTSIKTEIGDSLYPFSGGSGGSTTSASVMPAIRVTTGKALRCVGGACGVLARRATCITRGARRPHLRERHSVEGRDLEGGVPAARYRTGLGGW